MQNCAIRARKCRSFLARLCKKHINNPSVICGFCSCQDFPTNMARLLSLPSSGCNTSTMLLITLGHHILAHSKGGLQ